MMTAAENNLETNDTIANQVSTEAEQADTEQAAEDAPAAERDESKVYVSCGANGPEPYDLAGKTVGDARKELGEVMNIPEGADAYVDGDYAEDGEVLQAGTDLEFVKDSGENG